MKVAMTQPMAVESFSPHSDFVQYLIQLKAIGIADFSLI
jgi:hypothetical protein